MPDLTARWSEYLKEYWMKANLYAEFNLAIFYNDFIEVIDQNVNQRSHISNSLAEIKEILSFEKDCFE